MAMRVLPVGQDAAHQIISRFVQTPRWVCVAGDTPAAELTVEAGTVTGFLGPNGAGKSTTMRMMAALDAPTSGSVRVNGARYRDARSPLSELGVLLEARALHAGRSACNHLRSGWPTSPASGPAASAWA
jgi:ABC-type uncharacterized transport system ATPase subunit